MEKKRVNFSTEESSYLIFLIQNEPVFATKKTDREIIAQKKAAWSSITKKFNAWPNRTTPRTEKQLQKLWHNTKHKHKTDLTGEKKETMASAVGIVETSTFGSPEMEIILGTVDTEITSAIDSETIASAGSSTPCTNDDQCNEEDVEVILDEENNESIPEFLQKNARTQKRTQNSTMEDIYALKMKHLQEIHELNLTIKKKKLSVAEIKQEYWRKKLQSITTKRRMLMWQDMLRTFAQFTD